MVWKVYGVFLIVVVLAFAKHEIFFVQRLFLGNKITERGWGGELVPRRTLKATRSCKQLIKRLISKLIDLRNLARPLFFYCGRFFVFFSCDRILEQTPFFPRIANSSSPRHFVQLFFCIFEKIALHCARWIETGKIVFPTYDSLASSALCIKHFAAFFFLFFSCLPPMDTEWKSIWLKQTWMLGEDDDLLHGGNCQALDICNRYLVVSASRMCFPSLPFRWIPEGRFPSMTHASRYRLLPSRDNDWKSLSPCISCWAMYTMGDNVLLSLRSLLPVNVVILLAVLKRTQTPSTDAARFKCRMHVCDVENISSSTTLCNALAYWICSESLLSFQRYSMSY